MKEIIFLIGLILVVLTTSSTGTAQEIDEAEEDWLGSREGLQTGKDAKEFLSSVGIEHELTRVVVRLKRRRKGQGFSDSYRAFETWREIDTTDENSLKIATMGLQVSLWHPASKLSPGYGTIPFGEIIMESDRGKIRIFLDPSFILDDGPECYDSNHRFVSWTLTKLIDELLRDKYGEGLKQDFFERASGERGLKSERDSFEKLWKSKSKE